MKWFTSLGGPRIDWPCARFSASASLGALVIPERSLSDFHGRRITTVDEHAGGVAHGAGGNHEQSQTEAARRPNRLAAVAHNCGNDKTERRQPDEDGSDGSSRYAIGPREIRFTNPKRRQ